ncbi:MAG: transcription antitermination factor NusB [Acidobacteriia bacterium]|nr:transcription antitermination factor NusB [Terriglobia bacterium]
MVTRRKSRELALQMLFQWDTAGTLPEEIDQSFWDLCEEKAENHPFARRLFIAATSDIKHIDQMITQHSEHWRLERMPRVDRNILRLAIAEFLTESETPKVVIINEALEIARRFSGSEAVLFVNGILDRVREELEGTATPPRTRKKHSAGN